MAKPLKSGVRNVKRATGRGAVRTRAGTYSIAFGGKVHYGFKTAAEAAKAAAGSGKRSGGTAKPVTKPARAVLGKASKKAPPRVVKGKELGTMLRKPKELPNLTTGKRPGGVLKGKDLTAALRAKKEKSAVSRQAKKNRLLARKKQATAERRKESKIAGSFKNRFLRGFSKTKDVIGKGRELLSKATGEAQSLFKPFIQGGGSSGGNKFSKISKNNARYARAGRVGGKYKHTRKGGGYQHTSVKKYNFEQRVKVAKKTGNRPT